MTHEEFRRRLREAHALVDAGMTDAAVDATLALWSGLDAATPQLRTSRAAFLAGLISSLVRDSSRARELFAQVRDRAGGPEGPPLGDAATLRDWVGLNVALGQPERILSWLDRIQFEDVDPAATESPWGEGSALTAMRGFFTSVLREAGRWEDIARWFPNPIRALSTFHANTLAWFERASAGAWAGWFEGSPREIATAYFRDRAALVYASLLAAGREDEARDVAKMSASLDRDPVAMRVSLVFLAVAHAGQARPEHLEWLREAPLDDERATDLRAHTARLLGLGENQGPDGA